MSKWKVSCRQIRACWHERSRSTSEGEDVAKWSSGPDRPLSLPRLTRARGLSATIRLPAMAAGYRYLERAASRGPIAEVQSQSAVRWHAIGQRIKIEDEPGVENEADSRGTSESDRRAGAYNMLVDQRVVTRMGTR